MMCPRISTDETTVAHSWHWVCLSVPSPIREGESKEDLNFAVTYSCYVSKNKKTLIVFNPIALNSAKTP